MSIVVPDTSVWIGFLRRGTAAAFVRHGLRTGSVRPASVVVYELYLGAAGVADKQDLDRIWRAFAAGR